MTTSSRFILGKRAGPEYGVFVAPPGVDPNTAPSSQLLLHIANKIDQIILQGVASTFPATVTLGLTTFVPTVFLQSFTYMYDTSLVGIARPFPNYWSGSAPTMNAAVSTSSMLLSGGSPKCCYIVINRAAP